MEYIFEHESDHFTSDGYCNTQHVKIAIAPFGVFEIEDIYDEQDEINRNLEDFPENERNYIIKICQQYADENHAYAHNEFLVSESERAWERSKAK